jgi:hypothetical protein
MKILAWDIENRPGEAYIWTPFPDFIPITQIKSSTEIMCFAARWVDKKPVTFMSEFHDGREAMLNGLWSLLDEADALVSWNGAGFDTKHANRAFLAAGMTPPSPVKEIDLLQVARRRFKFMSNKLDFVAQQLGLGAKTAHEGFALWLACMEGDPKAWARMKRYNKQDVNLLIPLYETLKPWIKNHPNVATHDQACPRCNSTRIQLRGTDTTQAGVYQRFQCLDCAGWGRFAKRDAAISQTRPI